VLRHINPQAEICTASSEVTAFMAAVDGINTVDEIAGYCGFTRAEAIVITAALIAGGAIAVAGRKQVQGHHVPEDFASTVLQ
jgi:CRP-like cAMP-binding protein